ncbi:MAG TPA: hypothetical protein VII13_14950 [Vicinamibacteria bacterium]|jgi:hypothetical protein
MRRLWATAVLAALLPALAGGARASADPHACSDHACFCRKAAASPSLPCHGTDRAPDASRIQGSCSHDDDITFPLVSPWVSAAPAVAALPGPGAGVISPPSARAAAHGDVPEPPPPRLA